jgi:hypothetical protein
VSSTTTRVYERLPELYRRADEAQDSGPSGYPLLRFLSLLGDQLGELETLVDRVGYFPADEGGVPGDTSDLTDPVTADDGWLGWLGQLVGVDVASIPAAARRAAVAGASAGWRAGTADGIASAAQSVLTGTRYVRVIPHYTGDPWKVEVRTRVSETPDPAAVIPAIVAARAKPAGVELVHTQYEATWDAIVAENPTWADLEPDTWTGIEEAGAP